MGNNSNRRNSNNRGFLKSLTKGLRKMSTKVSNSAKNVRSRVSKSAKNVRSRARNGMKNVRRVSRKRNGRNNRRNGRNGRNGSKRNGRRNNRGNMSGGAIEYSPLPCDANGNTNFDSTLQVGHETCVEYGTHGAENDARFDSKTMDSLSDLKITETIKDVVDKQLKEIIDGLDGQSNEAVRKALQERATALGGSEGKTGSVQGAMDPKASMQAYQLAQDRLAAQNQTTAVSQ